MKVKVQEFNVPLEMLREQNKCLADQLLQERSSREVQVQAAWGQASEELNRQLDELAQALRAQGADKASWLAAALESLKAAELREISSTALPKLKALLGGQREGQAMEIEGAEGGESILGIQNLREQSLKDEVTRLNHSLSLSRTEVADLQFRLSMQSKRASLLDLLRSEQIGEMAKRLAEDESLRLCFCGGATLESAAKTLGEMRAKVAETPSTLPLQSVDLSVIGALKEEIAELIKVSEARRVDRNSLARMVFSSEFFKDLWAHNKARERYISELEGRLAEYNKVALEISLMRAKETGELREAARVERLRLEKRVEELRGELAAVGGVQPAKGSANVTHPHSSLLIGVTDTPQPHSSSIDTPQTHTPLPYSNLPPIPQPPTTLPPIPHPPTTQSPFSHPPPPPAQSSLSASEFAFSAAVAAELREAGAQLALREAKIAELRAECSRLQAPSDPNDPSFSRPFRHKVHEEIFRRIEALLPDTELGPQWKELEKYVKSREARVASAEKELRVSNDRIAAMIGQLASAYSLVEQRRKESESLKSELEQAEQTLATNLAQTQSERAAARRLSASASSESARLAAELRAAAAAATSRKSALAEAETKLRDLKLQRDVYQQSALTLAEEKSALIGQISTVTGEKELIEKRLQAIEVSQRKLTDQLADNTVTIAQRNAVIEQLVQSVSKGEQGLTSIQIQDFFHTKLELKKLKDRWTCTQCQERDKEVVIGGCYHAFCEKCVDEMYRNRNRKCPLCTNTFFKETLHKLY